jgi:hypothetical protein
MSPIALFYLLLASPAVFDHSNIFGRHESELFNRFETPFSSEWTTSYEPRYTSVLNKAIFGGRFHSERSILGELFGSRFSRPSIFSKVYEPEVEIMRHVLSSRVNPTTRYLIKKVLRNIETVNPILISKVIRRLVKDLKHRPTSSILKEMYPYTPYTPYTPEEFSLPLEALISRINVEPMILKKLIKNSVFGRKHFSTEKLIRKLIKRSIKHSSPLSMYSPSSSVYGYSYPIEKVIRKMIKRSIKHSSPLSMYSSFSPVYPVEKVIRKMIKRSAFEDVSPLTSTYSISKVLRRNVHKEEKIVKVFCNYCMNSCMRTLYTATPVCEICNEVCIHSSTGRRVVKRVIKRIVKKLIKKSIRRNVLSTSSIYESPIFSSSYPTHSTSSYKLLKNLSKYAKYNKYNTLF